MKNENHDLRVSARTARLTAGIDDDGEDGPPYTFSGIAVAAGDILHMDDGTPVLFTEEELERAAETQAGEPLSVDHPEDDDGRPLYPPPTSQTAGKVPKSGWLSSQRAVGYEATTHDEEIAQGVQAGSYEVSVHPAFELGEQDPETGAWKAENIKFRDLSVVSKGDSPSNTAEWGPNHALASYTESTDIGAELTASENVSDDDRQGLIATTIRGTLQAIGFEPTDLVAGGDGASNVDELAESSAETDTGPDMDRENLIKTLVDEHDFDQEWLEDADDDHLERLSESLVESGDGSTDTSGSRSGEETTDDEPAVTFETEEEFNQAVDERLEEQADQVVATAQARADKREKAEEIVARSDDFEEDDLEDLIASPKAIVDREYKRVRGEGAAQFPGNASGLTAAATARQGDDPDRDEYGTGVAGDDAGED